MSKYRGFLNTQSGSLLLFVILRIYSSTFRISLQNEQGWLDYLEGGGKIILLSWHQQFFPFAFFFKKYRRFSPSLMISQSKDGELIARIATKIGWRTARGSSSMGGLKALDEMKANLNKFSMAGHIADGPRGPIGVVKKGVIHLAHDCGALIVPVYAKAENSWFCNSWDKFMIPKPFSKITVTFDNFFEIPAESDAKDLDLYRSALERQMKPHLL